MGFKVIIFWENSCTDELFLKDGDEVEEILWGIVTYVIYFVRRNRKTILTILLLWGVLHDTDHSFHDVIDIGEVALAVAIVEYLDGVAFHQLVGEAKVCHIWTASRTINCKETQASRRDVVEFTICMSHKLVTLLCGGVEAHGVVHLVVCRIRHLLVAAIDR